MQFTEAHGGDKNTCITWNTASENYKLFLFFTPSQHKIGGGHGAKKEVKRNVIK